MADASPLEYARASRRVKANEAMKAVSDALDSLGRVDVASRWVEAAIDGARSALLLVLGALAREADTADTWNPPKKTEGR